MSIAPMYVTFGDQKQQNGDACTLRESKSILVNFEDFKSGVGCQMTVIAQLYSKILLTLPLFSFIYFLLSWAFVSLSILFLIYNAFYKKQYQSSNLQGYTTLGQDSDEEETDDL